MIDSLPFLEDLVQPGTTIEAFLMFTRGQKLISVKVEEKEGKVEYIQ